MSSERDARRSEFEQAALPHIHSLHNVAVRLVRRREEAEDLVQETLLRAYRSYDTFEAGTNLRAWLFRILRNLVISRYQSGRREPEAVEFGGMEEALDALLRREGPAGGAAGLDPEEILLAGAIDEEIERALRELPQEYRLVLLLSAMEDLSYREIAEALSCPIGTVMSRLHRARRLMQSKLLEYARGRGLAGEPPREGENVVRLDAAREVRRE